MPQQQILTSTAPAQAAPSPIQWILIESCPDFNRHPEILTPEAPAAADQAAVRNLLAGLETPFLQGGGGVANMLRPHGPHAGAVVEVRSVRRAAGEDVAGYAPPQIIGWGGLDDVDAIMHRNARLLRDLAFPEGPVTVSCEYYFATRM